MWFTDREVPDIAMAMLLIFAGAPIQLSRFMNGRIVA
jgi:hypothetical protein